MLGHPVHEHHCQRRLADAAHAQYAHHPAMLLHHPLRKAGQFRLSPIEARHIRRIVPVHPATWSRPSSRQCTGAASPGWRIRTLSQQGGEPRLIQQYLLVCRLPERADLLFLAPQSPGLMLDTEGNEAFEALGFGITAACLPAQHCSS